MIGSYEGGREGRDEGGATREGAITRGTHLTAVYPALFVSSHVESDIHKGSKDILGIAKTFSGQDPWLFGEQNFSSVSL